MTCFADLTGREVEASVSSATQITEARSSTNDGAIDGAPRLRCPDSWVSLQSLIGSALHDKVRFERPMIALKDGGSPLQVHSAWLKRMAGKRTIKYGCGSCDGSGKHGNRLNLTGARQERAAVFCTI